MNREENSHGGEKQDLAWQRKTTKGDAEYMHSHKVMRDRLRQSERLITH